MPRSGKRTLKGRRRAVIGVTDALWSVHECWPIKKFPIRHEPPDIFASLCVKAFPDVPPENGQGF